MEKTYERKIENFDIEHIREVMGNRNGWMFGISRIILDTVKNDTKLQCSAADTSELASRLDHLAGYRITIYENDKAIFNTELNITREGVVYFPYGCFSPFYTQSSSCAVGRGMIKLSTGSFIDNEEGREKLTDKLSKKVFEYLNELNNTQHEQRGKKRL